MRKEKKQEICCKLRENEQARFFPTKIKTFLFYFQTLPKENTPPTSLLLFFRTGLFLGVVINIHRLFKNYFGCWAGLNNLISCDKLNSIILLYSSFIRIENSVMRKLLKTNKCFACRSVQRFNWHGQLSFH